MITVNDDLSVEPAREFETVERHVARIVVTVARILVLPIGGRPTSELDPVRGSPTASKHDSSLAAGAAVEFAGNAAGQDRPDEPAWTMGRRLGA